MKKLALIMFAIVFASSVNAQSDLYFKIGTFLQKAYPEIITSNKLIAINIWNVDNLESRESNKSFEKAYKIYEYAKLKGGSRGFISILINKDNLSNIASIAILKDGIKKSLSLKIDELEALKNADFLNIVFDSDGKVVYKNLPSSKVFESVNQLITR